MSSEFMPMALDSLARQQSARAAGSGASSRITEEELEELGIPVNKPGENDMGLDFNDFLQLMVQQLQNQRNPRRLSEPVPLEALHLDYPPQSWRWLDSINADGLAEIAAAQGVKL